MNLSIPIPILIVFALLAPTAAVQAVDFKKDIQPILKDHCFKCHSGPRAKRKIRYDNLRYFAEVIGTHEDAVVIPGNPNASKLLRLASLPRTATDAMPPPNRGGTPMSSSDLALVRKWIEAGASLEDKPSVSEQNPNPSPTPGPDMTKLHDWENTQGAKLKAAFVSMDATSVKLRKEDGSEFSYPLDKLSKKSQDLAKFLAK